MTDHRCEATRRAKCRTFLPPERLERWVRVGGECDEWDTEPDEVGHGYGAFVLLDGLPYGCELPGACGTSQTPPNLWVFFPDDHNFVRRKGA